MQSDFFILFYFILFFLNCFRWKCATAPAAALIWHKGICDEDFSWYFQKVYGAHLDNVVKGRHIHTDMDPGNNYFDFTEQVIQILLCTDEKQIQEEEESRNRTVSRKHIFVIPRLFDVNASTKFFRVCWIH